MITLRRDGAIASIILDRASARNAIDAAGWDAFGDAVESLATTDAAVVILRSDVTGTFSAGADLTMLAGLIDDPAARPAFRQRMARVIEGLARLPMPTIAAVDGGCYGAAVALTLACDICVAGDDAVFAITPAKLGIGYPGADVARLIDRVGRGHAARLLYTAVSIGADEAARTGLVHVRTADASREAHAIADRIAENAPSAVRLLKRTIADPGGSDADFDAAFGQDAFATRLSAFRDRPR